MSCCRDAILMPVLQHIWDTLALGACLIAEPSDDLIPYNSRCPTVFLSFFCLTCVQPCLFGYPLFGTYFSTVSVVDSSR